MVPTTSSDRSLTVYICYYSASARKRETQEREREMERDRDRQTDRQRQGDFQILSQYSEYPISTSYHFYDKKPVLFKELIFTRPSGYGLMEPIDN